MAVEIDEELIQDTIRKLTKHDFLQPRRDQTAQIHVKLFHASLVIFNPHLRLADTIVAMEVIEHLDEDELSSFPNVIFGAYHPTTVIVTTPNYGFNKYFDSPVNEEERETTRFRDPTGRTDRTFRQADHRFEWLMVEFQAWCKQIASTYGYKVEFTGVGSFQLYPTRQDYINGPDPNLRPPNNPDHFFASQIAVFHVYELPISDYTLIL